MYSSIHVCMSIHTYNLLYTYIHMYVCTVHMYVCLDIRVYSMIYLRMYVRHCMYARMSICMEICAIVTTF